jgi:hypothetical protein
MPGRGRITCRGLYHTPPIGSGAATAKTTLAHACANAGPPPRLVASTQRCAAGKGRPVVSQSSCWSCLRVTARPGRAQNPDSLMRAPTMANPARAASKVFSSNGCFACSWPPVQMATAPHSCPRWNWGGMLATAGYRDTLRRAIWRRRRRHGVGRALDHLHAPAARALHHDARDIAQDVGCLYGVRVVDIPPIDEVPGPEAVRTPFLLALVAGLLFCGRCTSRQFCPIGLSQCAPAREKPPYGPPIPGQKHARMGQN